MCQTGSAAELSATIPVPMPMPYRTALGYKKMVMPNLPASRPVVTAAIERLMGSSPKALYKIPSSTLLMAFKVVAEVTEIAEDRSKS